MRTRGHGSLRKVGGIWGSHQDLGVVGSCCVLLAKVGVTYLLIFNKGSVFSVRATILVVVKVILSVPDWLGVFLFNAVVIEIVTLCSSISILLRLTLVSMGGGNGLI
jgi:hypothetical protein